ncbi:hypothetical protein PHLGIDRAFT_95415 [Phlebiopsis gigantea 11061_1 CR5-6]|uniref:Uncharacterized protein n=1 Tax=Phlebiopsis gigantea (strain 11061_1 CR5-6) TaxID=745531 RepID=A0A0C3S167_PHLG1|nr:hypothetical protein PHLGIDRAFT_95415 [Phlebiopsis gigantea 11061_1 CR5-6]
MENPGLPELFDPLLDFLSSKLPPQLYDIADTLLTHTYSLASSLFVLIRTLASNSPFQLDAQQILPPLITLFAAYLALVSFYRTTGWMIRTAFAFVKWGFILSTLGAAAGYFLANANVDGAGNGLGAALGGGLLPTLGGLLLGLSNPDQQNAASRNRRSRPRTSSGTGSGTQRKDRPKAYGSWDKHKDWQYKEQAYHQGGDGEGANVQKILGDIGRAVQESGWWDAAKGAMDGFTKGTPGEKDGEGEKGSKNAKGKSKSTRSR